MRKFLGIALIILGLIVLGLYFGFGYLMRQTSDTAFIEELSAEELQANNQLEIINNYESVSNVSVIDAYIKLNEVSTEYVIGQIVIPDVNINLPVSRGTNESNLLLGATTMRADQMMGQGHYPLAGHNISRKGVLFHGIDTLPDDTDIFLTDKVDVYRYKVIDRIEIPDTDFSWLENDVADRYGKPTMCLVTCTLPYRSGVRVIVLATLEEVTPYEGGIKIENE